MESIVVDHNVDTPEMNAELLDIVRLLLSKGAAVDVQNAKGKTPLQKGIAVSKLEVTESFPSKSRMCKTPIRTWCPP